MTAQITACLIACNEELVLPRCLDSLAWADEIVVIVDAKSYDRTEEIARARGHRVEVRTYEGNIEQKSYCTTLASHDWVFSIDSDEVVTPELAREIRDVLSRESDSSAGFEVNRITFHLGRWVRHGDFYPDWKLRLFRRSRATWMGRNPHGRVEVEGSVQRLCGRLEHYSYLDLADQIARIQSFSGISAGELFRSGRRARLSDLVVRPPARFVRAYLVKAGFRDGMPGLIIAAAVAFSVFLKYAKLWELGRRESR